MEYKKLGANVRKYRKIAGLTQEELAEIIGCSNSHIGQIENGRGVPSLDMMVKIANALGVMIDQFVVLDGELRETQTTDYFSKHRRSDCAVRELTAR